MHPNWTWKFYWYFPSIYRISAVSTLCNRGFLKQNWLIDLTPLCLCLESTVVILHSSALSKLTYNLPRRRAFSAQTTRGKWKVNMTVWIWHAFLYVLHLSASGWQSENFTQPSGEADDQERTNARLWQKNWWDLSEKHSCVVQGAPRRSNIFYIGHWWWHYLCCEMECQNRHWIQNVESCWNTLHVQPNGGTRMWGAPYVRLSYLPILCLCTSMHACT